MTDVVADHGTSVAQILTAIRVVATRSGALDLAEWAEKEVGGYVQDDELPTHRVWDLTVTASLYNPLVGAVTNAHVGALALPEAQRRQATTHYCRDGVGDLEVLLMERGGKVTPMQVEHPNLAQLVNAGTVVGEGWTCTHATAEFSPVHLMKIVTKARQTALTLCLQCEDQGIELRWLGNHADETGEYRRWLRTLRAENTREAISAIWAGIRAALYAAAAAI